MIKKANELKRQGRLDEAIAEYRHSIKINPNFAWAHYELGDALVKSGSIKEAIAEYRRAVELNSNYIWFYFELAATLCQDGEFYEAFRYYKPVKKIIDTYQNLYPQRYKSLVLNFFDKLNSKSTYLSNEFISNIDLDKVSYVLEIGSRDAQDAIILHEFYQCRVDTFECNPESIELCINNLEAYPSVNLIPKAVWDSNQTIPFYVSTNGNLGASSCFEETGDYPFERYNPYQTFVEAIRLDSYLTRSPDLICMDLQGAELRALKGLGKYLKEVKYIITETQTLPIYKNISLQREIVDFLEKNGFELKKYRPVENVAKEWFGDALFVNRELVENFPVIVEKITNSELLPVIDLQPSERKVFSQNGEDGIIEKIFEVIGMTNKYYVEFGVENAVECNTRNLRENWGWSGLLMDGGCENQEIGLHKQMVNAENINHLFEKYSVPNKFDLLSIDIDFNDFYTWKSLDEVYEPRVVVIKHNASHSPTEDKVVKYDPNFIWDGTNYFGASIRALYNLGKIKGYSLIYAESMGVNLFFVKDSILSKIEETFKNVNNVLLIYRFPKYGYEINGGHRYDDKNREYLTSQEVLF